MLQLLLLTFISTTVAQGPPSLPGLPSLPTLPIAPREPPFFSTHINAGITEFLNLTTGELAKLSGNAMKIVETKCETVSFVSISKVGKYLTKLISKTDPVPGKSKQFKSLLKTMEDCQKSHHHKHKTTSPIADLLVIPFKKVKKSRTSIKVVPKDVTKGIIPIPNSDSGFFSFRWIQEIFLKLEGFVGSILPFKKALRVKRSLSDEESSTISPPEGMTPIKLVAPGSQASSKAPATGAGTKKNKSETASASSTPAPGTKWTIDQQTTEGEGMVSPSTGVDMGGDAGKKAFGKFIDNVCRIYCDTCHGKKEVRSFRLAARELLLFIFDRESNLQAASTEYLDPDFIQELEECG